MVRHINIIENINYGLLLDKVTDKVIEKFTDNIPMMKER